MSVYLISFDLLGIVSLRDGCLLSHRQFRGGIFISKLPNKAD